MSEASLLEFLMSSRSSRTTRQSYDEIQTVLADLHSWAACISWEESPAPWRPPLSRRGCTLHGTSHYQLMYSEAHLVSGRSSACHWSPPSCCQCKILTEIKYFIHYNGNLSFVTFKSSKSLIGCDWQNLNIVVSVRLCAEHMLVDLRKVGGLEHINGLDNNVQ